MNKYMVCGYQINNIEVETDISNISIYIKNKTMNSKIIKAKDLLEVLKTNPEMEIKLYNGFVDDWVNIGNVSEVTLVRLKPKILKELCKKQDEKMGIKLSNKRIVSEWEFPNEFVDYEESKDCYEFKKVLLIESAIKNKSTFDRMGDIQY